MSKIILLMVLVCISVTSCGTSKTVSREVSLEGSWELTYITGPKIAFNGLYPEKKPTISFNLKENKIVGHNSCNKYFGTLITDGAKINFKDAKIAMTMMSCNGNGDSIYMEALDKIESYTITDDGNTLNFLIGKVVMMRFTHQK